jgi:hypothetical protein
MMTVFRVCAVVAVAGMLAGCGGKKSEALGDMTGSAAGVSWQVPQRWAQGGERPMRVATYVIAATGDDAEHAECAVSFFGSGQGGDVQSNISRWTGQFEDTDKPVEDSREINGLRVSTVRINGVYLSPGGPMMQSQGKKAGYGMLGAIVEAPEGMVFFKVTGPAATVRSADGDFEAMLSSLKK